MKAHSFYTKLIDKHRSFSHFGVEKEYKKILWIMCSKQDLLKKIIDIIYLNKFFEQIICQMIQNG